MTLLKSNYKLLLLIIILFNCSNIVFAKEADSLANKIFPEVKVHYGFIIRHHKVMEHLTNSHFTSYEINILHQTDGSRLWHQKYAYPQTGISLWYSDLGNNEYVGSAIAITPFINFPLFGNEKLKFSYRFGIGLCWLTKKFDRYDDYRNIAISSNINASIKNNFELDWYLKNIMLSAGVGLTHFSDGGFKKPNLGLNVATLNIGLALTAGKKNSIKQKSFLIDEKHKKNNIFIFCRAGSKGIFPPGSGNYMVYEAGSEYLLKLSYKSSIGGGIEMAYDMSEKVMTKRFGDTITNNLKYIKPSVFIAYQLKISKLKLQFNIGQNLYSVYKEDGSLYNRLAIIYPITDKILINLSLKSYSFRADVTEFGIKYRIN